MQVLARIVSSTPKAFNTIAQGNALGDMETKTHAALEGRHWECFALTGLPCAGRPSNPRAVPWANMLHAFGVAKSDSTARSLGRPQQHLHNDFALRAGVRVPHVDKPLLSPRAGGSARGPDARLARGSTTVFHKESAADNTLQSLYTQAVASAV